MAPIIRKEAKTLGNAVDTMGSVIQNRLKADFNPDAEKSEIIGHHRGHRSIPRKSAYYNFTQLRRLEWHAKSKRSEFEVQI